MEAKETLISGLRWFCGTFSLPQQSLFIQYSASQNLLSLLLHHSENMQPDLFLSPGMHLRTVPGAWVWVL